MDIIDEVTYNWEWNEEKPLNELTRRAFLNVFDPSSEDAMLVARYLVGICRWTDENTYANGDISLQQHALHNVIRSIKKQLNMKKIEEEGVE